MSNAKLKWDGDAVSADIKKAAASGLKDASEFLLDEARKLVPLDEGVLSNSGNTSVDEKNLEASVYFDTVYAVKQHEDLTLQHLNGRSAKYLETPFKANQKRMINYVADNIKKAV